jgi:hypothetical protein
MEAPAPSSECGGPLLIEITGSGVATHTGTFSATQRHCLNPATSTFSNGQLHYTAANGDEVWGEYDGGLAPTPDPIIVTISGEFEWTGGTGRFANATAGGTATGPLDVTTGIFTLALDGTKHLLRSGIRRLAAPSRRMPGQRSRSFSAFATAPVWLCTCSLV